MENACHFNGTLLISVVPPVLLIEFFLGVLGNGLTLWIFIFHLKPWKSSTVLLFNLAMADFFLNIALPFRVSYYMSGIDWKFGATFCNVFLFMVIMNRTGSAFFLMVIAVDRYMRVVHPHHPINSLSVPKAVCGAVVLWLFNISVTAHIFFLDHPTENNRTYCEGFLIETEPKHNLNWHKFEFVLSFVIPLLVILFCTVRIISYLKKRQLAQQAKIKKALYFITVVVVLFIICFLPGNIMQVLIWIKTHKVARTLPRSEVCAALESHTTAFYITLSLTYLNSALDPVVYYFSSPVFKNICRNVFHLPQEDTVESSEKKTRDSGTQSVSQL